MKNWSYTINDIKHPMNGTTLWSGRYCGIVGFVFAYVNETDSFYVLVNKRGKGTPDYQGYWNCPCGFLEADETAEEGIVREIYEETGVKFIPDNFELYGVQTDPAKCNNGNVSLRYIHMFDVEHFSELPIPKYTNINGEENEVDEAKWMLINEINLNKFAFGHDEVIKQIFDELESSFNELYNPEVGSDDYIRGEIMAIEEWLCDELHDCTIEEKIQKVLDYQEMLDCDINDVIRVTKDYFYNKYSTNKSNEQ